METVLYELIELVINNIDKAMLDSNQPLMLLSLDIAIILSDHIHFYSSLIKLPAIEPSEPFEKIKQSLKPNTKKVVNILRKLLLRL